jgi:hypothetical protein
MTPLQVQLCADLLDLEELKADLVRADARRPGAAGEVWIQVAALSARYNALARAVLEAGPTPRPFES